MSFETHYIHLVVYTAFVLSMLSTIKGENCSRDGYYTIARYGASCQYRCRCVNEEQCDRVTGSCLNGCALGWMGPGCQYRNIAPLSTHTEQYGDVGVARDAPSRAIDGDHSTCTWSYRDGSSATWWRIEFPVEYYIVGFVIKIQDSFSESFRSFRIEGSIDSTFVSSTLCYHHNGMPGTARLEVMCWQPMTTKHIRIIQSAAASTLQLCEVEIYGGRYVSYKAYTWQTNYFRPWGAVSSRAVDGRPMLAGDEQEKDAERTCASTDQGYDLWWTITFPKELVIQGLDVYGRRLPDNPERLGQIKKFKVFVKLLNGSEEEVYYDFPPGVDSDAYQPRAVELVEPRLGIRLQIRKDPTTRDHLSLCEVEVFAECAPGTCGWACSDVCQCSSVTTGSLRINGLCPYGCKPHWIGQGGRCDTACADNTWGTDCINYCHCLDGERCDFYNGICPNGCAPGWKPTASCNTTCDAYKYGIGCSKNCGNCRDSEPCNVTTGHCPGECNPGWRGRLCKTACDDLSYGQGCNETCGSCRDSASCNKETGFCGTGCVAGLLQPLCKEKCPDYTYGYDCKNACGRCKDTATCDHATGVCPGDCEPGWKGDSCIQPCADFTYGQGCDQTCGQCSSLQPCDKPTGRCADGCTAGFRGDICKESCSNSTYGANCLNKCGQCRDLHECNTTTGHCPGGCEPGVHEPYCTVAQRIQDSDPSQESSSTAVIAAVVSCVLVIAIVVVLAVVFVRRRRNQSKLRTEENINGGNFETINTTNLPKDENSGIESSVTGEVTATKGTIVYEVCDNVYVNACVLSEPIAVSKLREYCHKVKLDPSPLFEDFKDLPNGRQFDTNMAVKEVNRSKNRYRDLYPYDKNRVVLPTTPEEPDADYINASFIDGYKAQQRYIAAQGAMKSTVADIWRMVWANDIAIIVMLTGCYEQGRHKCEQYWPDEGSSSYGDIQVASKIVDIYADHTTRTFEIKKKECTETKTVTQYHFTGWPDKDVPDDTLSLVQFWRIVKHSKSAKNSPWMVHCSAGIGRTGTFVALDYLYDQGKGEQTVDVKQCVHKLRDQRVNMVQTKEQYLFVHQAVHEALNPVGGKNETEQFMEIWRSHQSTDDPAKGDIIFQEYKALSEEAEDLPEGHEYATFNTFLSKDDFNDSRKPENTDKSRDGNILPPDRYRPRLSVAVEGRNDYINAVLVSTFRMKDGLVLSQLPLESTVVDCLRLIWQYKINTVVLMEKNIPEDCSWWPHTSESSKCIGPFTVLLVSEELKNGVIFRRIHIKLGKGVEEREVMQFHFQLWPETQNIPESTTSVLGLISEVESWHRKTDNSSPILVQCLDGATRSGLFGVLWSILERIKSERTVVIAEKVRLMRVRRKQIIPNYDQYRHCWAAAAEYLEGVEVYGNVI